MPAPHRRPRFLRRWRIWLPLAFAALWWLPGWMILLGAPAEASVAMHRVRAGDTIPRLCWQYKVRAEAIRAANPGVDDPLPVGRKISIPLAPYEKTARPRAAVHAAKPSIQPTALTSPAPRASPRPGGPGRVVATTRLPPPPPETPAPAPRPVTVLSAEAPRP